MQNEELIQSLRSDAEWAHANEWETPITLGDHLDAAADALEAADKRVKELEAAQRWIPCSERMPEKSGNYLCWNMSSKVRDIETWEMEIFYWEENLWLANARCFATRHPAYWQPLPQPPQKGE